MDKVWLVITESFSITNPPEYISAHVDVFNDKDVAEGFLKWKQDNMLEKNDKISIKEKTIH